jgi:hypothetical protein
MGISAIALNAANATAQNFQVRISCHLIFAYLILISRVRILQISSIMP